ncbi:hypothetical protein GCM10028819_23370 [Spirosoma humi]
MKHRRFMRRRVSTRTYDYWHVWTMPILMGVLSVIGLLAALVGDAVWDGLSWLCLAIPLVVIGWFLRKSGSVKRYR